MGVTVSRSAAVEGFAQHSKHEGIAADTSEQRVHLKGTGIGSILVYADQNVIACTAIEFVAIAAAIELIVAFIAIDSILFATSGELVIANAAEEQIAVVGAHDGVISIKTANRVDIRSAHDPNGIDFFPSCRMISVDVNLCAVCTYITRA